MQASFFSRIRSLLRQHGTRIFVPLLLVVLSVMSYLICREPASSGLPVSEQCTRVMLPIVAVIAVAAAALERYFASLFLFAGHHVGIILAMIGTKNPTMALLVYAVALMIFAILAVWSEVLAYLLPKWRKNAEKTAQQP